MKTVAIIQARMGSTRLPGKSVMPLAGMPLIWHVAERVSRACLVDQVVVAIPLEKNSAKLIKSLHRYPALVVPGDPNDLIHRYAVAAELTSADIIVRVPGDNPCVEPDEIDRIIKEYHRFTGWFGETHSLLTNLDQNVLGNGYPGGLGAEVYTKAYLQWLDRHVEDPRLREHPHKWAFENNNVMTCKAPDAIARPELQFSVNTLAEYEWIKGFYNFLYPNVAISNILGIIDGDRNHGRQRLSA